MEGVRLIGGPLNRGFTVIISSDNRFNPQLTPSPSLIHLCFQQVTCSVHELIIHNVEKD